MGDKKRTKTSFEQLEEKRIYEALDGIKRPSSYLGLLKERNFLFLWMGQAISNTGDWIIIVALVALIYRITGSALAVGVLMGFKILPAVLLGPLVGVFVDRFNRKRTMIFCDVGRGILIFLLPLTRSIFQIYLIAFLLETMALFFTPAKDALLPNLVEREHLLAANSLSYTTTQLTMVLGLGFGSTIVLIVEKIWGHLPFFRDLAGPYAVFYIDAFTFFVSAATVAMIATGETVSEIGKINYLQVKDDLCEGIEFLRDNPTVRAMIGSVGVAILGGGCLYTLGVVYLDQIVKVSPNAIGPVLTALAIGMLIGALSMSYLGRLFSKRLLFVFSIFAFGIFLILFVSFPYYELVLLFAALAGVSLGSLTVVGRTFLQENVKDEIRGRVFVALESVLRVSLFISMAFAGIIADIIGQRVFNLGSLIIHFNGARTTLILGGVLVIFSSYFLFKTIQPSVRK